MRMILLIGTVLAIVFSVACSDLSKDPSKDQSKPAEQSKQEPPCAARFAPVGNNPEIALDTQTGSLCRTVADTNDPLGIRDPDDKSWPRGAGDKNPDKYTSLPVCSKVIVATSPNRVPTFAEWQKSQEKNGSQASPPKP
jgi:hypothetical protein